MRCLTLFAGAGGADVGLADAGIEHALSVEWDEDAAATSRAAGFPCVTGDVRNLALYEGVEGIDLLWSSFPCQDFSTAGKRAGAKGDRNGWPWTIDVLEHLRAQGNQVPWLIAENVRGLTMHLGDCPTRNGDEQTDPESCPRCYLDGVIMVELRERFAWAEWRILDAADYGVPQRRRRIIIVAGPHAIEWPEPTHSGEALAVAKWVSGEYWREFDHPLWAPCCPDGYHCSRCEGCTAWACDCPSIDEMDFDPYSIGGRLAPVGTPSAQEARWLAEHRQQGLFGAPPRFKLKPWRTVRQALGLGGTLEASRNTEANPTQERPQTTDEPIFAVGGKGNQYLSMVMQRGRDGTGGGTNDEHTSVDAPSVTISGGAGGSTRPMLAARVIGGWHNPNHSGDAVRNLRDITDEPSTTIAAQLGGGAGNAGPFVESRAGSEPGRLDRPAPTLAAGSQESSGPNGRSIVSANQATREGLLNEMGRRRLTPTECSILQGFPVDLFQGNKTSVYRQIGNAAPPRLAQAAAEAVLRADDVRPTPAVRR